MYLPLGESSEQIKVGRAGARVLVGFLCLAFAGLVVFGDTFSAYAACLNPSPLPSGYAAPCPVWSVSPASLPQSGSLTLSAMPQPGTDYIYTTAYYAKGSTWLPVTLTGNNAAPSYSTGVASGSLPASILSTLPTGTNYVVLWDWLWDATTQCYKGPGLNQCNTGTWRVQTFSLTAGGSSCLASSTSAWQDQTLPNQTGSFELQYDATPNANGMDGITGLSQNPAQAFTDLAVISRFNSSGNIDAINGGSYQAVSAIPYIPGTSYHFRFDINIPTHTYSAYVTSPGQAERTIGLNYGFRTEQATVSSLSYANILVDTTGSFTLCNALASPIGSYTYSQAAYAAYTYSQSAYTTGCTNCNNYYVSPTGSDSNAGTQTSPWATINHAASALSLGAGGAMVNVAAGTYGCTTTSRAGTSGQPIIYRSTTPLGAKITCSTGAVWFNDANGDYVTIQGFEITGTGANCYGITTHGAFTKIIGNTVHDIPAPTSSCGSGIGGAGIETGGGGATLANNTDDQIIGNIVDNVGFANGQCNTQHGIYVASPRNIVQNNIESRACGWGIQMFHVTTQDVISNNTVMNNLQGGIMMVASDGGAGDNTSVFNNIVVKNANANGIEERFGTTGPSNTYRNNLLVANVPAPFAFVLGTRVTSGNLCDVPGTGCGTVISSSQATLSNIFVNYTGNAKTGDYHLKTGSVAINAGATGACASGGISPCTPSTDFSGKTRTTPIDIGAYEF